MVKKELKEFGSFLNFLFFYCNKYVLSLSRVFEKYKNQLVKLFLAKRGRYNRPFLHITTMAVLAIGVMIAPFVADTYPIFAASSTENIPTTQSTQQQSITLGDNVFQTEIAPKPRSEVVTYTVEKGDTLSSIAQKFSQPNNPISMDSIRWLNNMTSDDLTVGDQIKIPPVTGIVYKVQSGDTVYTIAKKFSTDAQGIVDFPFNTFANNETFALVVGEILIVPNGVQEAEKAPAVPYSQSLQYAGPVPVASGGWIFPLPGGIITQYASWYHMALDIAMPIGTPIHAAHAGTISEVSVGTYDTGYGNNVYIDDGDGFKTHYAHMLSVSVSVGQQVTAGQVIGFVGLTGRTTGPHTHFEILRNGVLVDPLPYVGD
ncbi:MAG TPA: M23 family metallopeptidase [Patescibacteria group bacterium]|nr:M23 family metallopeptidase [Patescibacteria group bacterium]